MYKKRDERLGNRVLEIEFREVSMVESKSIHFERLSLQSFTQTSFDFIKRGFITSDNSISVTFPQPCDRVGDKRVTYLERNDLCYERIIESLPGCSWSP